MKYLRFRATPDPDVRPPVFDLLADAPFVTETRLVDWNVGSAETPTLLFSITGEIERFREAIGSAAIPEEWDLTPIDDERFYCYVRLDPVPLLGSILEAITTEGLIVATPVVYREGTVHARFVGEPAVLEKVLAAVPSVVDVDVEAVGEWDGEQRDPLASLSERQRRALEVAVELGYFQQPRAATHADVAERMGCSSSTASEHLQKAQAKLVRALVS